MNLNKLLASMAFATSFGLAAPASAAVVLVEYTGTVSEGYDTTGVFGTVGSLTGLAYTANYTFETTYGYVISSSTFNQTWGGGIYGVPSPVLSATVTINGNTVAVAGSWFGQISGYNDGFYSHQSHQSQEYSYDGSSYRDNNSYNFIYNYNGTLPASITAPLSYAVTAGDTVEGFAQIYEYDLDSTYTSYTHYASAYAYLTPDHLTISAPVPEPETYALLLAGLSLLGFAARRRKLKEIAAV